jgi:hypothetical protein
MAETVNPAGAPVVHIHEPSRGLQPPSSAVIAKQSAAHNEADFLRDLKKATRRVGSDEPDQGPTRT